MDFTRKQLHNSVICLSSAIKTNSSCSFTRLPLTRSAASLTITNAFGYESTMWMICMPKLRITAMGTMAMAFGASPLIVNPVSPALSSLGVIMGAVWSPPDDGAASAYKIMVAEDGLYRLDAAFFANNGIDPANIDLDAVRIYHMGEEVAVLVNDQDNPSVFDANDYIEFYGQRVADQYDKYAVQNIYWLVTAGGIGTPKRMVEVDGTPAAGPLATEHSAVVHLEDDEYYVGLAPGTNERDRWFFDDFVLGTDFTGGPDPVQVPFDLTLPGVIGQGNLIISLWGYYDTGHQVEVWVNDVSAGTFSWSGVAFYEVSLSGLNLTENTIVKLACHTAMDGLIVDYMPCVFLTSPTPLMWPPSPTCRSAQRRLTALSLNHRPAGSPAPTLL
jgi:hypothetical protein